MDDYYVGAEGAKRLINELDHFLQRLVDNVEAEELSCSITLRVADGTAIALQRVYLPELAENEGGPE